MIRVFIVDDERSSVENLRLMLKPYDDEFFIVGNGNNVLSSVSMIKRTKVDVLFLDISLPDGSGFDVLEMLGTVTFKIVFFTAYEQYAIKAIKERAFDYLLKPVLSSELARTMSKLKEEFQIEGGFHKIKKIAINTVSGLDMLKEDEIAYCRADNNYAHIHLLNGEMITVSKPLKSLEGILSRDTFIRPHQSFLLNIGMVKKYFRSDSVLVLVNDEQIPVSRANRDTILRIFGKYGV